MVLSIREDRLIFGRYSLVAEGFNRRMNSSKEEASRFSARKRSLSYRGRASTT
jgi:hypothetical protein